MFDKPYLLTNESFADEISPNLIFFYLIHPKVFPRALKMEFVIFDIHLKFRSEMSFVFQLLLARLDGNLMTLFPSYRRKPPQC